MYRKALPLLAIWMLARPALGRQLDPAGPGGIVSTQAIPAALQISGLQVTGPFSLWCQFASLFMEVATVSARSDP